MNLNFKTTMLGLVSSLVVAPAVATESLEIATYSAHADVADFLKGGELKSGSEQFAKLSLAFKDPQNLKKIEFESCDGPLKDGVEAFIDPGFRHSTIEGGVRKAKIEVPAGEPVRSLAIVFGRNRDFCVKGLKLSRANGEALTLKTPTALEAKVTPEGALAMFDSHPQTWPLGASPVTIEFKENQTFDRLLAYQSLAGDEAKSISVTADGKLLAPFEVATSTGVQELKFEKPVTAKKWVLKTTGGKLSDLRFANADDVFFPVNRAIATTPERQLATEAVSSMLDREWISKIDEKDAWVFRFRSDRTFYVRGYGDDMTEARAFSLVGAYEVTELTKKGALLRLVGLRFPTASVWDGVYCPFECGGRSDLRDVKVDEPIELEEAKGGAVMIRDRAKPKKRTLPFSDLKSQNSAFDE